jgi:ABC-type thiamine transport system ATPase subunit
MYGDIDITTYSLEEWRKMFSYTPQHPNSETRRSWRISDMQAQDVNAEEVDAVLRNGLDHVADAFKPRYNKTVGGRRQTRAVSDRVVDTISVFKAPVVMLDEPGALDPASRNDVMNL